MHMSPPPRMSPFDRIHQGHWWPLHSKALTPQTSNPREYGNKRRNKLRKQHPRPQNHRTRRKRNDASIASQKPKRPNNRNQRRPTRAPRPWYQHQLQVEGIINKERQRDAWRKEVEETLTQLTKHYEQTIALVTAKAKDNQATCELLVSKCQEDAKAAREELEAHRAQIGMDDTRIKILIDKYRQQLTKKIEETLGRAGQAWSAQAAELHILRADAENQRKEV